MSKIITFAGTRPELIRLSRIIPKLDKECDHKFVYLGQNYDKNLKDIFFDCLNIRKPDLDFENKITSNIADATHFLMKNSLEAINKFKPEKILILGDTNSSFASAYISERKSIPVYHMEAGNRAFDKRIPEEINRYAIDAISTYNLPYTEKNAQNLYLEGQHPSRILVTGNPIGEVILENFGKIDESKILKKLKLIHKSYIIVTLHREENVDNKNRLLKIFEQIFNLETKFGVKIIISVHPRTRERLKEIVLPENKNVIMNEPFNFIDFCCLQKNALLMITDSGTSSEEGCIFKTRTLILRDSTERKETVEAGISLVCSPDSDIMTACDRVSRIDADNAIVPQEYLRKNVSETVVNFLLGN